MPVVADGEMLGNNTVRLFTAVVAVGVGKGVLVGNGVFVGMGVLVGGDVGDGAGVNVAVGNAVGTAAGDAVGAGIGVGDGWAKLTIGVIGGVAGSSAPHAESNNDNATTIVTAPDFLLRTDLGTVETVEAVETNELIETVAETRASQADALR